MTFPLDDFQAPEGNKAGHTRQTTSCAHQPERLGDLITDGTVSAASCEELEVAW